MFHPTDHTWIKLNDEKGAAIAAKEREGALARQQLAQRKVDRAGRRQAMTNKRRRKVDGSWVDPVSVQQLPARDVALEIRELNVAVLLSDRTTTPTDVPNDNAIRQADNKDQGAAEVGKRPHKKSHDALHKAFPVMGKKATRSLFPAHSVPPAPVELWFDHDLKEDVVHSRRASIKQLIPSSSTDLSSSLPLLLKAYDDAFFHGLLLSNGLRQGVTIKVAWGTEFDKRGVAGTCGCGDEPGQCVIHLHPGLLTVHVDEKDGESAGGVLCRDRLDCIQAVLEHELVHAIISVFLRKKEIHGPHFKRLSLGLFRQTDFHHWIGLGRGVQKERELRQQHDKRQQIQIGQIVRVDIAVPSGPPGATGGASDPPGAGGPSDVSLGTPGVSAWVVVVQKTDAHLSVIHPDGSLSQKVPYHAVSIPPPSFPTTTTPTDGVTGGPVATPPACPSTTGIDVGAVLTMWSNRFLTVRQHVKINDRVEFHTRRNGTSLVRSGRVRSKRPLQAMIACDGDPSHILLPYHSMRIVPKAITTPSIPTQAPVPPSVVSL